MAKIAVIIPSRGLIFSRTAEEILLNIKNVPVPISYKFYFSHRQPIPDCFEKPVNEALKDETVTHLWLVEDDMALDPDTLSKMLKLDKAVVTINYPTTERGNSSVLSVKGRVVYGGTGCVLIKRAVFDELKKPYFRTDIVWIPKNKGDFIKFTAKKKDAHSTDYGLHDVNFYMNLYRLEIPVHLIDGSIGQRKLVALGKSGSNNGAHKIKQWRKVKKDRYFTLIKNLPVEDSGVMTTVLVDGREYTCTAEHAKKLIKKGLGTKPPKRAVVLDDLDIL